MEALEKLIKDNTWQDIKDAPRDGTMILLRSPKNQYFKEDKGWYVGESFWDDNEWCFYGYGSNPTHFRPLPDNRLAEVCQVLIDGINNCIEENLHLADGDNCTLIDLKIALAKAEEIAGSEK